MDALATSVWQDNRQASADEDIEFAPRLLFWQGFCQSHCVHRKFATASVNASSTAMLSRGGFGQACRLTKLSSLMQARFSVGVSHCRRSRPQKPCTTERSLLSSVIVHVLLGGSFSRSQAYTNVRMCVFAHMCSFLFLFFNPPPPLSEQTTRFADLRVCLAIAQQ